MRCEETSGSKQSRWRPSPDQSSLDLRSLNPIVMTTSANLSAQRPVQTFPRMFCCESCSCPLAGAGLYDGTISAAMTGDSIANEASHDPVDWPQMGMGFSTAVGNLFYIPAKIAYGTLGGLAGGAAYVLTRGDHHVAHEIWRNSLGGDYVLSPDGDQGTGADPFRGFQLG